MRLADRRNATRFEVVGTLWGELETVEALTVRNLGRHGALVEARCPVTVGSIQVLRLVGGDEEHRIATEVRHLTLLESGDGDHRYIVGLEFLNLDGRTAAWIDRVVEEYAAVAVSSGG